MSLMEINGAGKVRVTLPHSMVGGMIGGTSGGTSVTESGASSADSESEGMDRFELQDYIIHSFCHLQIQIIPQEKSNTLARSYNLSTCRWRIYLLQEKDDHSMILSDPSSYITTFSACEWKQSLCTTSHFATERLLQGRTLRVQHGSIQSKMTSEASDQYLHGKHQRYQMTICLVNVSFWILTRLSTNLKSSMLSATALHHLRFAN